MLRPDISSKLVATVQAAISLSRKFLEDEDDPENFDYEEAWNHAITKGQTVLRNVDDWDGNILEPLFKETCLAIMTANYLLNEAEDNMNSSSDESDDEED